MYAKLNEDNEIVLLSATKQDGFIDVRGKDYEKLVQGGYSISKIGKEVTIEEKPDWVAPVAIDIEKENIGYLELKDKQLTLEQRIEALEAKQITK